MTIPHFQANLLVDELQTEFIYQILKLLSL